MSTQLYSTTNVDAGDLAPPLLLKLHALEEKQQQFSDVLSALVRALETKDYYLYEHSYRVMYFTLQFAQLLNLAPGIISTCTLGALFHDLGKISLSNTLLHKPSRLTDQEFDRMRQHPVCGALILNHMPIFRNVVPIVHCHHEWWNGAGYPNGICGEAIPLGARIVAITDAYEVMTSTHRSYRQPCTHLEALAELCRCAGTQFDPTLVPLFCTNLQPPCLQTHVHAFINSGIEPGYQENRSVQMAS